MNSFRRIMYALVIGVFLVSLYLFIYWRFPSEVAPNLGGRLSPLYKPLDILETRHESKYRDKIMGGRWVSDSGVLSIEFSHEQNLIIHSDSYPQFEYEGFWSPNVYPTIARYRFAQINIQATESESITVVAKDDTLQITRWSNFHPPVIQTYEDDGTPTPIPKIPALVPIKFKR